MKTISDRLNFLRGELKLSQPDAATRFGIPYNSYIKYEHGSSKPGTDALEGIARAGINANWLLTGEGEMLLSDIQAHPAPPDTPYAMQEASLHAHQRTAEPEAHYHVRDLGVLHTAILLAEEASAVQSLSVDQRAELILSFYNRLSKSPAK